MTAYDYLETDLTFLLRTYTLIAPNARPDRPCQMTQADDARSDWQGTIVHNPKQLKTGGRERP